MWLSREADALFERPPRLGDGHLGFRQIAMHRIDPSERGQTHRYKVLVAFPTKAEGFMAVCLTRFERAQLAIAQTKLKAADDLRHVTAPKAKGPWASKGCRH